MVSDDVAKAYLGDDGFIWEVYNGDQNAETIGKVVSETEKIMDDLQKQKKPIHIIVDTRNFGKTDLAARQIGGKVLRAWPYEKLAAFGPSKFFSTVINFMIIATGHSHNIRSFATEEEAKAWLNEPLSTKIAENNHGK